MMSDPSEEDGQSTGRVDRRTFLQASAGAATPLFMTGFKNHDHGDSNQVEQLHGTELTKATINALQDNRTQKLIAAFYNQGVKPRMQDISGVKIKDSETGETAKAVTLPFETSSGSEDIWIQHSTASGAEPSPVTGFHTTHYKDPEGSKEPYWKVRSFQVSDSGEVVQEEYEVKNLFGCPNDEINPQGLTKLAADYALAFTACSVCVGSSTVFTPSCGICLAQIARTGASLDDYNWCECEPGETC